MKNELGDDEQRLRGCETSSVFGPVLIDSMSELTNTMTQSEGWLVPMCCSAVIG